MWAATSGMRRDGMMRSLVGTIIRPRATLAGLARSRRLDMAVRFVVSYGLLYTATAMVLARRGLRPVVRPLLPIREEDYYTRQAFFTLPVVAAGWGVLSAVTWTAIRATGRQVELRDCATVLGVASSVPWIVGMWVPETAVGAAFPQYWGAPEGSPPLLDWIGSYYLWGVTAWAIGLCAVGLEEGTGTDRLRSLLAASLGVTASTGFQMIFVR